MRGRVPVRWRALKESPAATPRRTPPADVGRRWPESEGDKIPSTAGEGYKFHLVVEVREFNTIQYT
jgi:hypothetical protein